MRVRLVKGGVLGQKRDPDVGDVLIEGVDSAAIRSKRALQANRTEERHALVDAVNEV